MHGVHTRDLVASLWAGKLVVWTVGHRGDYTTRTRSPKVHDLNEIPEEFVLVEKKTGPIATKLDAGQECASAADRSI